MRKKVQPAGRIRAAGTAGGGLRVALCCAAVLLPLQEALALSLGRMQGTPTLGRPLQVAVPVTLQPDEELPCVRGELLQAEMLPAPLTWRLDRQEGGAAVLRLTSTQNVLEPVITVRLAVGCKDQFTQGYVLLADPPRETVPLVVEPLAAPTMAAATAPSPARAAARPAPAPAARQDGMRWETTITAPARPPAAPPAAPAVARAAEPDKAAATPRRAARVTPAPPPARPAAVAGEGRPRLQVDLLDIEIDQAPALKASTQLTQPAVNALTRTEAAAAWQQINASPEQQMAAAAREQNQAVQAEIKALREQTRRQSEQLQMLVEQRNLVRDVISGVAGAIALGLLLLLWRRSRDTAGGRPWWQKSRPVPVAASRTDSSFVDSSFPDHADPPVRLAPEPDSSWGTPARAHVADAVVSKLPESTYGRSRLPSADELLDVQEKANFFLAVGQPEKAIELLETRLMEHLGGSPFLWLDLLDLCRKLNRRADYERVRQEFQKAFAARMPDFDDAQVNSEGLERYPKALSRIQLLWPSSRVLLEIEKSLFEEPAPGSIMFDLEASRDLLLLYSVAMDVVSTHEDGRPYDRTEISHLETEEHNTTMPMPLMSLDDFKSQRHEEVALDLDFGRLVIPPPTPAPVAAAAAKPVAPSAAEIRAARRTEPREIDWVMPDMPAVAPPAPAHAPAREAVEEAVLPALDLDLQAGPTLPQSLQLLDEPPAANWGLDIDLDFNVGEPAHTPVK